MDLFSPVFINNGIPPLLPGQERELVKHHALYMPRFRQAKPNN